ncbi:DinB family protein [Paenibacillus soyae]|uniref:DinB family protein n=1 Tax=Paenibacillus soyae TaxID=2969249 RepID=A0A9X2SCC6_9BACL|nr:DinB family protein [Paenibacillus soyae]MCR2806618.1 DinB family protein [Paenibacillus soyae]
MFVAKPSEGQYPPPFIRYFEQVPEGDVIAMLEAQELEIAGLFGELTEEQSLLRYAEGKWSMKEALGHIMDTERIMTYRLLCAARSDQTPLPLHPDSFVYGTSFDRRPLGDIIAEFRTVRTASLALLRSLTEEELGNSGIVGGSRTKAAALAYFKLGHAQHHITIHKERYLPLL